MKPARASHFFSWQSFVVLLLFSFSPLILIPIGNTVFEGIKGIVSVVIATIIATIRVNKTTKKYQLVVWNICLSVLTGIALLHFIRNPDPLLVWGNFFRFQGIFFYLLLFFIGWRTAFKEFILPPYPIIPFLGVVSLGFSQLFLGTNEAGRSIGPFGEPNTFALYSVFLFFLGIELATPVVKKRLLLISPLLLLIIIPTQSFSALMGYLVAVGILFSRWFVKIPFVIILTIILCMFLLGIRQVTLEGESSTDRRIDIWNVSYEIGLQNPFIGTGFGSFEYNIAPYLEANNHTLKRFYIDDAHNIFLHYFVSGGLFSVLSLLGILIISMTNAVRNNNELIFAQLVLLLTGALFNPQSSLVLVAFWFTLGRSTTVTSSK